ncbi:hypothetical protein GCM10007989_21370 [Devosia pacifica]|uniref:Glycosyltransferase 2-like domain-containing protein n=1 Tax=Devosia pacifica TaxID=1335967 RepID=A0A918S640_9HYPH|nr:glycosyltransferase [Devosia pacifica]GHA25426.1 hypothetical protein GCM10007989_21370 [Devosia pacifica]
MTLAPVLCLVPAYKPDRLALEASLASLLRQTQPTDIMLIDDGSPEPIERLHGSLAGVEILRLENNGGITRALSRGVEEALRRGYGHVARLDVGDIAYPERMARQLIHMQANPHLGLLGCRARVHDETGKTLFIHGVTGGPDAVAAYLKRNAAFKHSSFMLSAEALRRYGNYDTRYRLAQDYELALRLSQHLGVDCLDTVLIDYEQSATGLSARHRQTQLRMRLKAQWQHKSFDGPSAGGMLRTLATLAVPAALAARLSQRNWAMKKRPA